MKENVCIDHKMFEKDNNISSFQSRIPSVLENIINWSNVGRRLTTYWMNVIKVIVVCVHKYITILNFREKIYFFKKFHTLKLYGKIASFYQIRCHTWL